MSYSFELVRARGADAHAAVIRRADVALSAATHEQLHVRATKPASDAQRRLANAIRAEVPVLEVTHDSALHIELTAADLVVQVSVHDDGVDIALYVFPERVIEALRAAWDCMRVCRSVDQLVAYDPQIERVLDLATDFEVVLGALAGPTAVDEYRRSRA